MLVHHADPHADRLARRVDVHRLAAEEDLALVGLQQPVEDVHERRLARPVLPEQGVHLAAAHVEIDAVVRDQRAEALGDALQLEGERVAFCGQGYLVGLIGMSVMSPAAILSSSASTWSAYFAPSSLVSPYPTPPDLRRRPGRFRP